MIAIQFASCTPIQNKISEMQAHLQLEQYREKLADGFFETVIQNCTQVISESEVETPADVAFYALGEVYAHNDYRGQDFVVSKYYFNKLINNFPDSPLTSEAKVYINLFDIIAAKEKETLELQKLSLQKGKDVPKPGVKAKEQARKKIIKNQNFDAAVNDNMLLLQKSGKKYPADQALFNLGLIYAHEDNPKQDFQKSQYYFRLLIEQFPESDFFEEAKIWFGLFTTIERIQQIDFEIEQQKKQLTD